MFSPYYMRRKKINPNDKGVKVDFTDDSGDSWQEFPVLHPKFKDWYNIICKGENGIEATRLDEKDLEEAFKQSPWFGSTANDIDWIKRVEMQSVIQKYTSHSISSTINLPESVTEEEVSEIYLEAWKQGLKGITVKCVPLYKEIYK
jgi:ribonucleoside-diphosphate reductase alpha chain